MVFPFNICGQSGADTTASRVIRPNHTYSATNAGRRSASLPNYKYADNRIHTTKYNVITFLPKNLFEQFHRFANIYFLFIQVLNWIPDVETFAPEIQVLPLVFVLGVTAVKDLFEDYRRHRSDKRVNNSSCRLYDSGNDRFVKSKWQDIKVGDIVHLSCNETVPADILLLSTSDEQGLCYVETSNLDGESNLKQRQVIKGYASRSHTFTPKQFTSSIECDPPNHQIYHFNGFITETNGNKITINKDNLLLRDCVLKNADSVDGIVVYAGHETKAMLNNGGPRYKRSKLERFMNRDVVWCVVILILMCIISSIGNGFWLASYDNPKQVVFMEGLTKFESPSWNSFVIFWSFVVLFQVIIPLSLYVTIELIKLGQIYHIHNDRRLYDETSNKKVMCRAMNITEDLGQIEYIFSDKTGTLTENRMVFRRCSIGGIDYGHERVRTSLPVDDNQLGEDFKLNPYLSEELNLMCQRMPSEEDPNQPNQKTSYELSDQNQRIQDFFILLAVCNSAVVTRHPHKDPMSASGQYLNKVVANDERDTNTTPKRSITGTLFTPITTLSSMLISPLTKMTAESRSTSPTPVKPIYESESPDEVALVTAAFRYSVKLLKRNSETVTLSLPSEGVIEFKVLNILNFDSTRKKMSIILKHSMTNEIIIFCKGSDTAILESLAKTNDPEMKRIIDITEKQLTSYSRKGLRTLCMSKRILTEKEYNSWNELHKKAEQSLQNNEQLMLESHNRIERDLTLMGATGIEDSLQERVPEVIAKLRSAGIVIWVLTGDKLETAVNIAYSCQLFNNNMEVIYLKINSKEESRDVLQNHLRELHSKGVFKKEEKKPTTLSHILDILLMGARLPEKSSVDGKVRYQRGLVIDGKTLSFIIEKDTIEYFLELAQFCGSVLCCRATPLQKGSIVRAVKETLNVMTLAIGDGANDVSMIQTADIGIGISGQEGTQAVMASDFALPRFLYLERLLLVYGNWNYYRLSRTVLYFFYKNSSSVLVIFWFQMFCGWSAAVMIDQLYLMIVNAIFTAFPPMILGIYDRDCSAELLLKKPHLYGRGRKSQVYTEYSFWVNMYDATFQSLVMFFVPFICYYDTSIGIFELGTIVFSASILVQLVHVAIEFRSWSALHLVAISFSIVSFFLFAYLYNWLTLGGMFGSDAYMIIQNVSTDPLFYVSTLLTLVVAPMPRLLFRVFQTTLTPSPITQAVRIHKELLGKQEKEDFMNNIPDKKPSISAVWTKKTSSVLMANTTDANKQVDMQTKLNPQKQK